MLAGSVSVGFVVSTTFTQKDLEPVLLYRSVDEHVTVVVPIGNVDPDCGTHVTSVDPPPASTADELNVATAPFGDVASTATSPDVVTTGGPHVKVRVNTADGTLTLPAGSVKSAPGIPAVTAPGALGINANVQTAPLPSNP